MKRFAALLIGLVILAMGATALADGIGTGPTPTVAPATPTTPAP